jgi:hypothetical protein
MPQEDYKNKQLGFDRTQLYKEFEGPMIRRAAALKMAQEFFAHNEIKYSPLELKTLIMGYTDYIEKGDMTIFTRLEKYLIDKGITFVFASVLNEH